MRRTSVSLKSDLIQSPLLLANVFILFGTAPLFRVVPKQERGIFFSGHAYVVLSVDRNTKLYVASKS